MGSIGVTTAGRGDARTASELLRDADTAMYAAKNERFGVRVFGEHHRQAVVERMGDRRRASEGPCTIERLDDSLTQLRDLAALGASLVIDEFGTGRSSLARVKKLDMLMRGPAHAAGGLDEVPVRRIA